MACCERLAGGNHLYIPASTYTFEQNLGGQPWKYFARNAQRAKIQDGHHKCLVYITFERFVQI